MARTQSFDLLLLRGSIEATFERRGTLVPTEIPFALTEGFLLDEMKRQQWRGFLRRLQLEADTPDLIAVGTRIVDFVGPLLKDCTRDRTWREDRGWHGWDRYQIGGIKATDAELRSRGDAIA